MTAEPVPSADAPECPLCGEPALPTDERCDACSYTLAGVDGRPAPFSRLTLWWSVAGFAAVYLVTLAIVALTR